MGPTSTSTRMRLSCNFVNVYKIAYRVQYTFTRVHAHIPNGQAREDPREEKRAARVPVESADKSARMSVSVSVPWNLSYMPHRSVRHAVACRSTKYEAVNDHPNPRLLQATLSSLVPNESSQTVPQTPELLRTSSRPSRHTELPQTSRTPATVKQQRKCGRGRV